MAWNFADSFDLYAAGADAINGYWDSGPNAGNISLCRRDGLPEAGQRNCPPAQSPPSSRAAAATMRCTTWSVAFQQTSAISGTTLAGFLQLSDGVTAQCYDRVSQRRRDPPLLPAVRPTGR